MNTARIFTWSIILALGGFLFGLDMAVISGAEQARMGWCTTKGSIIYSTSIIQTATLGAL